MATSTEALKHYDIKGIHVPAGERPPPRMECKDWCQHSDSSIQVSLFIRALMRLYDIPYTEKTSYFQLASIHGYPGNLEWDDGGPPPAPKSKDDPHFIYCPHAQTIFPTWHRPYMLLFEQRIHEEMLNAINKDMVFVFEGEKEEWIKEAFKWRMPYWDWSKDTPQIPSIFQTKFIEIREPKTVDGKTPLSMIVAENPLNRFLLKVDGEPVPMGKLPKPYTLDNNVYNQKECPWSQCSGTSRYGLKGEFGKDLTPEQSQGINEWIETNTAIAKHLWYGDKADKSQRVSDLVYRLFASVNDWNSFSTTKFTKPEKEITSWTDYVNLEYIHNNLHVWIGGWNMIAGLGHMSDVPVSAFDPVFWFHHCNVDRLFALWQLMHPDAYLPTEMLGDYTSTSDLRPFRHQVNGEEKFWNSEACRTISDLGYTYDTFEIPIKASARAASHVKTLIDGFANTGQILMNAPTESVEALKLNTIQSEGDTGQVYADYLVSVLYDKYALDGGAPYHIHFYLGDIKAEDINTHALGADYLPGYVGSISSFSSYPTGSPAACSNCADQRQQKALSQALLPLTIPLYQFAQDAHFAPVPDLLPETVHQVLIKGLIWFATDISGKTIDLGRIPRTRIFVLTGSAKHFAEPDILTEYLNYQSLSEATAGKQLGASEDEYATPLMEIGGGVF